MSGSRLIQIIRQQAATQLPRGVEMATVLDPPPALRIRIDNMDIHLEGDDLIVCEHLLEHTVDYSTSPVVSAETQPGGADGHIHSITSFSADHQTITIHSRLKAGDRVAVQALPGGQQYLVIDKVVVMSG